MRRALISSLSGLAACLLLSTFALAGKTSAADYPLRVHIFSYNGHSHYYDRSLEMVDGEGRANLYENSEPKGFDFSYRCADRLRVSPGYETYMARWKKPGREIEILLPVFGKPGAVDGCVLEVLMKDTTYTRHNGLIGEEPVSDFKNWMDKHQYDPEHGKDQPVNPPAPPAAAQSASGTAAPGPAGGGTPPTH
jgi:hypothetical protein